MLDDPAADFAPAAVRIDYDRADERIVSVDLQAAVSDDAIAFSKGVEGRARGFDVVNGETGRAQRFAQRRQIFAWERRSVQGAGAPGYGHPRHSALVPASGAVRQHGHSREDSSRRDFASRENPRGRATARRDLGRKCGPPSLSQGCEDADCGKAEQCRGPAGELGDGGHGQQRRRRRAPKPKAVTQSWQAAGSTVEVIEPPIRISQPRLALSSARAAPSNVKVKYWLTPVLMDANCGEAMNSPDPSPS